jgi:hypothetical protein
MTGTQSGSSLERHGKGTSASILLILYSDRTLGASRR